MDKKDTILTASVYLDQAAAIRKGYVCPSSAKVEIDLSKLSADQRSEIAGKWNGKSGRLDLTVDEPTLEAVLRLVDREIERREREFGVEGFRRFEGKRVGRDYASRAPNEQLKRLARAEDRNEWHCWDFDDPSGEQNPGQVLCNILDPEGSITFHDITWGDWTNMDQHAEFVEGMAEGMMEWIRENRSELVTA